MNMDDAKSQLPETSTSPAQEPPTIAPSGEFTEEELTRAFDDVARNKRPGIDGVTRESYLATLASRIHGLTNRLRDGTYRPQPVLRVEARKGGGGTRPIAFVCVEDKIVQRALLRRIESRFKTMFFERSFGRSGGGAIAAADQVFLDLLHHQPSVVVQIDIAKCFESFDHAILMDLLKPKLDSTELTMVGQMLKAEVVREEPPVGDQAEPTKVASVREVGVEQGMPISTFLANVFLHYALDEWLEGSREVSAWSRFVDDTNVILGPSASSGRFVASAAERLAEYGLLLNESKTQVVRGFAAEDVALLRPGSWDLLSSFEFVGATYHPARTRAGAYFVETFRDALSSEDGDDE